MVRIVCNDLKKMFSSSLIYICMIGLGAIYFFVYITTLSAKNVGIVSSFSHVADGSEIILVSFLLSIVGGSFLYCAEERYGYLGFEIQRIGVSRYTASKLITSVVGGFCTVMAGNGIFISGIVAHQFFLSEKNIFITEDVEYLVWFLLVSGLRCGMLSAIGFLVSTYIPNYYIAMTVPLLMYYALLIIEDYVSIVFPFIPSALYFTDRYFAGIVEGRGFVFSALYTSCILVIMHQVAKNRIERRLEHG